MVDNINWAQKEQDEDLEFFLNYIKKKNSKQKQERKFLLIESILADDSEDDNETAYEIIAAKKRELKRTIELERQAYLKSLQQAKPCNVCLNLLQKPLAKLPCTHQFCYQCIRAWLQINSNCPSCRCKVKRIQILQAQTRQTKKYKKLKKQSKGCNPRKSQGVAKQSKVDKYEKQWYSERGKLFQIIPQVKLSQKNAEEYFCYECGGFEREEDMLICDHCQQLACHFDCDGLLRNLNQDEPWYCNNCR